jgi:hypothetical protein
VADVVHDLANRPHIVGGPRVDDLGARLCYDHLAGALGVAMLGRQERQPERAVGAATAAALFERRWVRRSATGRGVVVTA